MKDERFRFIVLEEILDGETVISVCPENPSNHYVPEPGDEIVFPDEKDDRHVIEGVESFTDNDNYDITLEEPVDFTTGEETVIFIKPRGK